MARLQVLHLPAERTGENEQYPFILVMDQVSPDELEALQDTMLDMSASGARMTVVFPFTVDVL